MKNRRKRRYVDSAVQGALLKRIVLHWFLFFAIAFFALPLWHVIQAAEFSQSFTSMILEGWRESVPALLLLVAMLPIFVWDTLQLSHRFAGPMYRIHATIRSLIAGETFHPIRLRKGDFWTDVATDFNTMVEQLSARPANSEPLPAPSTADTSQRHGDADALAEVNGP
ncbi:MAG: hypothetical protein R6U98_30690 [Pirellulaceae bacterium]